MRMRERSRGHFWPRFALVALACASVTPAAGAEDACREDVIRLCPDAGVGKGAVHACLKKNEAALGEACRAKLEADDATARRIIREFGQACHADAEQFCPTVEPGAGRILGCLSRHQLEISSACQAELDRVGEARDRIAAFRASCGADLKSLCEGVPQQAGPLLECAQANVARVSQACKASDFRLVWEAEALVEILEEMSSRERVRESLEILQGLDSVAFSRSQILLQFDGFQALGDRANAGRLLFNPQFVFGERGEFALQLKVPVTAIYPYAAGAPTQFGLGAVVVQAGWNFVQAGATKHFLSLGLQMATASSPPVGGPWSIISAYAFGVGLARWVSLTTQLVWIRSVGSSSSYPEANILYLEPIFAFNLPGRSYLALDTRLGWDFTTENFLPVMKLAAGIFLDRKKSVSVSAWYQAVLSQPAADQLFKYEYGTGLAYFFDW